MWLGVLGLTLTLACPVAFANTRTQIVHIAVESTMIRPLDGQGKNWDGPRGGEPGVASKLVQSQGKRLVEKYMLEAGMGSTLAPLAAKFALEALDVIDKTFAPPDPFGEIVADGRVVGTLDVLQDTLTPRWNTRAAFVELSPSSVIELMLIDQDLSGAHDPIGTCSFQVPALKDSVPIALTSMSCSDDLLAASIVVQLADAPKIITPGRYRVGVARAGLPATDRDGLAWDPSGLPDPRIEITAGAKRFGCTKNEGQSAGVCEPTMTIDVDSTTTIGFRVVEVDALVDDEVGAASVADLVGRETHRPIAMSVRGVTWAEIVLIPVPAPR